MPIEKAATKEPGYGFIAAAGVLVAFSLTFTASAETVLYPDEPDPPCGTACLYAAARVRGIDVDWTKCRELGGGKRQHSFAELGDAAVKIGLIPIPIYTDQATFGKMPFPVLLHFRVPLGQASEQELRQHYVLALEAARKVCRFLTLPTGPCSSLGSASCPCGPAMRWSLSPKRVRLRQSGERLPHRRQVGRRLALPGL